MVKIPTLTVVKGIKRVLSMLVKEKDEQSYFSSTLTSMSPIVISDQHFNPGLNNLKNILSKITQGHIGFHMSTVGFISLLHKMIHFIDPKMCNHLLCFPLSVPRVLPSTKPTQPFSLNCLLALVLISVSGPPPGQDPCHLTSKLCIHLLLRWADYPKAQLQTLIEVWNMVFLLNSIITFTQNYFSVEMAQGNNLIGKRGYRTCSEASCI